MQQQLESDSIVQSNKIEQHNTILRKQQDMLESIQQQLRSIALTQRESQSSKKQNLPFYVPRQYEKNTQEQTYIQPYRSRYVNETNQPAQNRYDLPNMWPDTFDIRINPNRNQNSRQYMDKQTTERPRNYNSFEYHPPTNAFPQRNTPFIRNQRRCPTCNQTEFHNWKQCKEANQQQILNSRNVHQQQTSEQNTRQKTEYSHQCNIYWSEND